MRFAFIFVALTASVASASSLVPRQQFPACSMQCIGTAPLGDCQITDNTCLCNNKQYVSTTSQCITDKCEDKGELQQALDLSVALCKAAGVDLTTQSISVTSASPTGSVVSSISGVASSVAPAAATTTTPTNAGSINSVAQGALLSLAGAAALALSL